MEDLLTTRQVLEYLKVDRITVYRMLNDGRLKGVKIGQHWRFPRSEVERLLTGEPLQQPETTPNSSFPTHCVQTIQDLFTDVSQISALVVDTQGTPLTEVTHPCDFCQLMLQNPQGQEACRSSWRQAAQNVAMNQVFTCHAGLQYVTAPIQDHGQPIGAFLVGEFYWQPPDAGEETARIDRLSAKYAIDPDTLRSAADSIAVISPDQHSRVATGPLSAARAVQSILHERTGFMTRLQQIANLSQIL
jgi:excisionase family DNA binding protein